MPETPHKFFLTTPIYYVNARPHIGHAYTTIVADVLARRARAQGIDTFFLTGTDEHGQKIERSAAAAGIPPQQFADQVSLQFRTLWDRMGLTYNDYIRTTEPRHKRGAQKLFATLHERGFIYLAKYTGSYCVSDEAFVDLPTGTPCPDCGRPLETVTEENFFFKLSEFQQPLLDLIESNTLLITPEAARNEVLSFIRGGLKDLSISRSSFTWGIPVPEPAASAAAQKHVIYVWLDALANYMTALGYGSDDESRWEHYWPADLHLVGKEITRFHCVYWPAFLLAAGIPTPSAITANGWLLFDNSKMSKSKGNVVRTETILDAFGPLCPPNAQAATDEDGKDTPFLSANSSPDQDRKNTLSLSANSSPDQDRKGTPSGVPQTAPPENGVGPSGPTKHHQDLFAADILRYFLLREIPFGQDGSFSFEALITRYNADLANGYGNLVSRVLTMINKYLDGEVCRSGDKVRRFTFPIADHLLDEFAEREQAFDAPNLTHTLRTIVSYVGSLDQNLSEKAPWKTAKKQDLESRYEVEEVLYQTTESIRIITALLYPILPYATASVWRQLGLGDIERAARNGELKNLQWGGLQPGTKLGPLSPIFPRADKGLARIMTDMEAPTPSVEIECITSPNDPPAAKLSESDKNLGAPGLASETWVSTAPDAGPRTATLAEPNPGAQVGASASPTAVLPAPAPHHEAVASGIFAGQQPADSSPQITIDDFAKVELRVAQVLVCERIPKADKLLRLEVDLGYEKRQILSGIAEWYTPEELIGRRIVVITNLAPRKMRGLESHGMLLAASAPAAEGEAGGKPHLATFADADSLPLGSRLK